MHALGYRQRREARLPPAPSAARRRSARLPGAAIGKTLGGEPITRSPHTGSGSTRHTGLTTKGAEGGRARHSSPGLHQPQPVGAMRKKAAQKRAGRKALPRRKRPAAGRTCTQTETNTAPQQSFFTTASLPSTTERAGNLSEFPGRKSSAFRLQIT